MTPRLLLYLPCGPILPLVMPVLTHVNPSGLRSTYPHKGCDRLYPEYTRAESRAMMYHPDSLNGFFWLLLTSSHQVQSKEYPSNLDYAIELVNNYA